MEIQPQLSGPQGPTPAQGPGRSRGPWTLLLGALLTLTGLVACAHRSRAHLDPALRGSPMTESSLPEWVGESVTWEKLDAIESWLAEKGERADPFWRVEAELQLAEGRLAFASEPGRIDEATRRTRRRSARTGFLRIRSHPEASASQRNRATAGLANSGVYSAAQEASSTTISGVLPRSAWGARRANPSRLTRASSPWSFLTIHHSALEGQGSVGVTEQGAVSALRTVQRSQMDGRNFGDVGYHFLVDPAGRIWQGRDLQWQGAHAGGKDGRNNVGNMGICLLGNFDHERPTAAALAALDRLVDELCKTYDITRSNIVAHSDWKGTVCPGRYLLPHVRRLAR